MRLIDNISIRDIVLCLLALLAPLPLIHAQQPQQRSEPAPHDASAHSQQPQQRSEPAPHDASAHGPADRSPDARAVPPPSRAGATHGPADRSSPVVDRANHGDIRHVDAHVVERPVAPPRDFDVHQHVIIHHDVDVDIHRQQFWHGFVYGARHHDLRAGYMQLFVGGSPYYYDNGIYYQQAGNDYQEVYPPIGAIVLELPDGAIEIVAGNIVYYYAGGAFYVRQPGGFAIAPPPMGALVQELPPGSSQVFINGGVAYQFNGIHYRPTFVNGVTLYMTFER